MPNKKKITFEKLNFVPKDPFFQTPIGKILKWALSVGRYIVIFTELIVIVSFLTRFSLDRQVTDLNQEINQQKYVIESYGPLEENVRIIQRKTDEYKQVRQNENLSEVFPQLQKITPRGITLDDLTISQSVIEFKGRADSQNAFSLFTNNLELSPELGKVSIDRVASDNESRGSSSFDFEVLITRPNANTQNTTVKKLGGR